MDAGCESVLYTPVKIHLFDPVADPGGIVYYKYTY